MEPLLRGGDAPLAVLILESIKKTVDAQDPENTVICTVCLNYMYMYMYVSCSDKHLSGYML